MCFGQRAGAADGGTEQGSLAGVADFRGLDIGVEIGLQIVMRRHFVALAAFLVKANPPTLAGREIILDAHRGAALTRAKLKAITAISARSRRPMIVEISMLSSNWRACRRSAPASCRA